MASIEDWIANTISCTQPLAEPMSTVNHPEPATAGPSAKRPRSSAAEGWAAKAQRSANPYSSDEDEEFRTPPKVKRARMDDSVDVANGKMYQLVIGNGIDDGKTSPKKSTLRAKRMNQTKDPSTLGAPLDAIPSRPFQFSIPLVPLNREQELHSAPLLPLSPDVSVPMSAPDVTPPRVVRRIKKLPVSPLKGNRTFGRQLSFGVLSFSGSPSRSPGAPLQPPPEPGKPSLGSPFKLL